MLPTSPRALERSMCSSCTTACSSIATRASCGVTLIRISCVRRSTRAGSRCGGASVRRMATRQAGCGRYSTPDRAPRIVRRRAARSRQLPGIGDPVKLKLAMSSVSRTDSGVSRSGTAAMRKPKSPEANRARIVAAALDEFAARGFKGASMDAIAARTHTTRALINYYFGSKEKLYIGVLERVYSDIREAESKLDLEHLPPVEALRRIVEFTYHYYVRHVGFVRLVVAENQAGGRHLRKSAVMRSLNR